MLQVIPYQMTKLKSEKEELYPAVQEIIQKREQILQSANVIGKQNHIPTMSEITEFIETKEVTED